MMNPNRRGTAKTLATIAIAIVLSAGGIAACATSETSPGAFDADSGAATDASTTDGSSAGCGTSPSEKSCGGSCTNTATDNANCGGCGIRCTDGQVCSAGHCGLTCAAGLTACGGDAGAAFCTNTQTDRANCSTCGHACNAGEICAAGSCVVTCPGTEVNCGGVCVDGNTNRDHCGATAGCGVADAGLAGTACTAGQICTAGVCGISCQATLIDCNGTCVDPQSNPSFCGATAGCGNGSGSAGTMCTSAQACQTGVCKNVVSTRGTIFLIRDDTDMLQKIVNPDTTPTIADVGALGIGFAFGDCAWDSGNGKLYMTEGRATNSLYTINTTTGAATLVGVHGITDMFALAYYAPTNTLYANGNGGTLYTMNTTTGAATVVGTSGYLNGMAWDPIRMTMWAITSGGAIDTVNIATGTLTSATGTVVSNNNGMTYDAFIDRFWVANYNGDISKYNAAASWAPTAVLTGQGEHTAICYVP